MKELTKEQEEWLAALESGNYAQYTGVLRFDHYFCCLGVACDVSKKGTWKEDDNGYHYLKNTAEMPGSVKDYFGFIGTDGLIAEGYVTTFHQAIVDLGFKGRRYPSLLDYNDRGATFKQLAAAIRKYPEAVFI